MAQSFYLISYDQSSDRFFQTARLVRTYFYDPVIDNNYSEDYSRVSITVAGIYDSASDTAYTISPGVYATVKLNGQSQCKMIFGYNAPSYGGPAEGNTDLSVKYYANIEYKKTFNFLIKKTDVEQNFICTVTYTPCIDGIDQRKQIAGYQSPNEETQSITIVAKNTPFIVYVKQNGIYTQGMPYVKKNGKYVAAIEVFIKRGKRWCSKDTVSSSTLDNSFLGSIILE